MNQSLAESIPATDWNATPPAVRNVVLSLERERDILQARLERLEQGRNAEATLREQRLQRYHSLVEQQFLSGLAPEQQKEIERLGKEIDAANAAFYPSLDALAETIPRQTGRQLE